MLINCTNHPYELWGEKQRKAAESYGEVVPFPFPAVSPEMETSEMRRMAADYAARIEEMHPQAVLLAGEYTFAFMLVDKLLKDGVKVICSCSRRVTEEKKNSDGTSEKKSTFLFERFREYTYF